MNNTYYEAIEILVTEGYSILQISKNNEDLYFAVYRWQEGYFNTAQSIDFNTVEGINITTFLKKQAAFSSNRIEFINQFNKELESKFIIRCEFSKTMEWYKWSSPNVNKNGNGFK